LRITKQVATVTLATAAVLGGLALGGAVPASAATNPSTFRLGPEVTHSGCDIALFSARLSASTPAEVFASVDSTHPGHTCTGFVERSATGKTKWAVASAKMALPSVGGLAGIANTGLVYDGPGYKARACVQPGGTTAVYCTSALSLAKGAGTATSPRLSPSWARKVAEVFRVPSGGGTPGVCAGDLVSSTTAKKAGATVLGLLVSSSDPCTGWIQRTANGGKTWTTVSAVVSWQGPGYPGTGAAFTAHYADGPGHLARLCVKDMTSKKTNCSGGW
jgi:hypothetical protein